MNMNANAILRMPARWSGWVGGAERAVWFDVPDRLTQAELARTATLGAADPRLGIALRHARDGDVTATLAGETERLDRWRGNGGSQDGQAVVTAAVVARRCGHLDLVPESVLAHVAVADLSDRGVAQDKPDFRWSRHMSSRWLPKWLPSARASQGPARSATRPACMPEAVPEPAPAQARGSAAARAVPSRQYGC
jgi:hypothetical protein